MIATSADRPAMEVPTSTPSADPQVGKVSPSTNRPSRRTQLPFWVTGIAGSLALAAAYISVPQFYIERTNDAYVQADTVSVVPKVAGYVTSLHVNDNSRFKANDLLVEIDPRDFEVAVKIAEANLESAQAAKANVTEQFGEQDHIVAAAQATIASDRAMLQFSQQQFDRYNDLEQRGAGTEQRQQEAVSDVGQKKAALDRDRASLAAAQAEIRVLQSRDQQANATISLQQAELDQAKLNLSYAKIFASADGSVANRTVQVGNFVQPGQTLFAAVPTEAYIIANFKETQLEHMRVGQRVRVRIDAFPNRHLDGHVDSFQRGTGSNFALLPPENATGNFVKVVQRIPVKIVIDGPADALLAISPGMSVEPTVTITSPPRWLRPLLSLVGDPAR
jgi:membrane fusion protein, multidrug efflux system